MKLLSSLRRGLLMSPTLFAVGCGAPFETTGEVSQPLTVYQVGPGKPYANLQAVAPSLRPGDVVEVSGGTTYAGGVRFTQSGTAASKIRIVGVRSGGARPVLAGGTNTVEFSANHYVFEGFDVTAGVRNLIGKRDLVVAPGDYDRFDGSTTTTVPRVPGEGREVYVKVGYRY